MKFDAVTIIDAEGERNVELSRLPIRLGTGNDCEIRVPGPGSSAVALLDELDGEPFVQPVGSGATLTVNDEPLRASRKLAAGDVIGFFGTQIRVGDRQGALSLEVQLEGSAYVTRPPELADSGESPEEETIVATAFQRAADTTPIEIRTSGIRWQTIVGGVIAMLVLVSWLLFTSKSIQFDVQPAGADEVSVSGGWFRLPVGDRLLLREGTYTVDVSRQGYYDVSQSIEIDESPSRTIVVEMRKLPGQLTVVMIPQSMPLLLSMIHVLVPRRTVRWKSSPARFPLLCRLTASCRTRNGLPSRGLDWSSDSKCSWCRSGPTSKSRRTRRAQRFTAIRSRSVKRRCVSS